MTNAPWTIRTRDEGPIVADGKLGAGRPSLRRGATPTITFEFKNTGASTTPASDRYDALRSYQPYTSAVYQFQAYDGSTRYHEAPADDRSLLMGFEPGNDDPFPGFWGVVTTIEDVSQTPDTATRLAVTVLVLAELSDYPDRDAVEADLKL